MSENTKDIGALRRASTLFSIVAAGLSILLMKSSQSQELGRTLMIVSAICFLGVPFFYSILCVARRDKAAKGVALLAPLGICLLFAILYIIFSPSGRLQASGFALTLLACLVINLLPFWISIFSIQTQDSPVNGHRELLYWSWPAIIPALFFVYLALPLRANPTGPDSIFIVLVYLLIFSFVIYALLFAVKKIRQSSSKQNI